VCLKVLTVSVVHADIDAFDLEVACYDQEKLVDLLVALEPTFGGINLEDIKVRMHCSSSSSSSNSIYFLGTANSCC
jgi:malic enzyme